MVSYAFYWIKNLWARESATTRLLYAVLKCQIIIIEIFLYVGTNFLLNFPPYSSLPASGDVMYVSFGGCSVGLTHSCDVDLKNIEIFRCLNVKREQLLTYSDVTSNKKKYNIEVTISIGKMKQTCQPLAGKARSWTLKAAMLHEPPSFNYFIFSRWSRIIWGHVFVGRLYSFFWVCLAIQITILSNNIIKKEIAL